MQPSLFLKGRPEFPDPMSSPFPFWFQTLCVFVCLWGHTARSTLCWPLALSFCSYKFFWLCDFKTNRLCNSAWVGRQQLLPNLGAFTLLLVFQLSILLYRTCLVCKLKHLNLFPWEDIPVSVVLYTPWEWTGTAGAVSKCSASLDWGGGEQATLGLHSTHWKTYQAPLTPSQARFCLLTD